MLVPAFRFLRLPLQLSFKLGIGDPVLNIQELIQAEDVCDSEVGWKIQRLARKGYAMPKLATVVNAPFSELGQGRVRGSHARCFRQSS